MSRLSGAFWFALVIATGMTNFLVKQNVQALDDQLNQVRRKTAEDQKKIHDLTADWTFLNQPELLADLNNRYVHLAPMSPRQVVASLYAIPMRPAMPLEDIAPPLAVAAPPTTPATAPPATVVSTSTSAAGAPLSLIASAHAATVTAAASAPTRTQQPAPAAAPSLDGIFAQVSGSR
ncbi:MAG TPA: hypothetical protein VK432_09125 [Stellaceae bacterium]|nr:hypothetical protein [Stellaceae bacterium]